MYVYVNGRCPLACGALGDCRGLWNMNPYGPYEQVFERTGKYQGGVPGFEN